LFKMFVLNIKLGCYTAIMVAKIKLVAKIEYQCYTIICMVV